jgi:hypothetical protein
MHKLPLLAAAAALAFTGAAALAQSSVPSRASQATRSAVSIECSRQADAKGLHGKARQSFRSRCKRGLDKKG